MPYLAEQPAAERPNEPRGPWPTPPGQFDPAVGVRSVQAALDSLCLADELGFDWVGVTEHHYLPRLSPSPMLLAAALSQRIRRAHVATLGATLPILNPVRVAEEFALLDTLLEGRLVAGVLRGTPQEFVAYGASPEDSRERYHEGIELILRAWTDPNPFAWQGSHYTFPTVAVWPRPVQKPHPPVLVSGKSRESGRFAAQHRLKIGLSFETLAEVRDEGAFYRSAARELGWEPTAQDVLYRGYCYVAESDEQALEVTRRRTFGYRPVSETSPLGNDSDELASLRVAPHGSQGSRALGARPLGWDGTFFLGSPETVFEQVRHVHEAGVGVLDLLFNDNRGRGAELPHEDELRSLRLFGEEVLPRIQAL